MVYICPKKTKNTPRSNSHTLRIGARCMLLVGLISVMSLLVHFQFTELPDNTVLVIAAFIVVVKYHPAICRRFEVLTTVNMEIIVLRYVTSCTASFIPTPIYAPDYTAPYLLLSAYF
jgi:uncharacterized membrane protein